jgi:outer membrane protein assembly factor BamB
MYGSDGNEVLSQATGVEEGSFSGIPAFDGTTGFFATGDQVAADDVSNLQQPLWTVTLSATVTAGPVATPAAIWVGTGAWQLLALDPSTGAILAEFPLPGQPGGVGDGSGNADNMGVGNQLVVVPTTNKMLTAFG